jgi:phosphoheptose isomerase
VKGIEQRKGREGNLRSILLKVLCLQFCRASSLFSCRNKVIQCHALHCQERLIDRHQEERRAVIRVEEI